MRLALVLTLLASMIGVAHAQQGTEEEKATAQALFDDGMRLYGAGNYADACPKFAASLKHYPGLGTRGKLAECYEKEGKTASAWASFREVAALARQQNDARREQVANERVKALEPRLPHLTIVLAASKRVPGLSVTRNGVPVEAAVFGTAIAVDPGAQHIVAGAPGYESWTHDLTIEEKQAQTVEVPALVPGKSPPVATHPPLVPPPAGGGGEIDEQPDHHARRLAGFVAVGVGGVGLIVGGVFALQARSSWNDVKNDPLCTGSNPIVCDMAGHQAGEDAKSKATLANIFVIGGAAVAATGVVLWLISPNAERAQPSSSLQLSPAIAPGQVGALVSGSF